MTQPSGQNIVAKLIGWGKEGTLKFEVLADYEGIPFGTEVRAKVFEEPFKKVPLDFAYLRKKGLKIGGAVVMHRASFDDDGVLVCRTPVTMRASELEGPLLIKRDSAVFIHPPLGTSSVPKFVTVAMLADAVRVKSLEDCLGVAKVMAENAAICGEPSLMLTAETSDGTIEELTIPVSKDDLSDEAIKDALDRYIDRDTLKMMAKSKEGWWFFPLFKGVVSGNALKNSKVAAQRLNIDYGDLEEPLWTPTHAVLHGSFSEFSVCDVSPMRDLELKDGKRSGKYLIDFLGP